MAEDAAPLTRHKLLPPLSASDRRARRSPIAQILDRRSLLILALAFLAALIAYQAPATTAVDVGQPGDRLFFTASEGLGSVDATSFYGDELSPDARSGRSRWTRAVADLSFPGVGSGDLLLTLRARGWPDSILRRDLAQPTVQVFVGGQPIGSFTPADDWANYRFPVHAALRTTADLDVRLLSSATFTATLAGPDPRPKGVRLESVTLQAGTPGPIVLPPLRQTLQLMLAGWCWLLALAAFTGRATPGFVLATLVTAMLAIGLALARAWATALLPWLTLTSVLLLLLAWRAPLLNGAARLVRRFGRGHALDIALLTAGLIWLILAIAQLALAARLPVLAVFQHTFPDSLLFGMLAVGLLALLLLRGNAGLPRVSSTLVAWLGGRRTAPLLLAAIASVWIAYLAYLAIVTPYVGHADYADNAVVARNLVAGRGWAVDYVTQFYRLYDGVTRPQETWPLLQPVWIAPWFVLFGATDAAAKIPNLIFMALLTGAVYLAGARIRSRSVGLVAALLVLSSRYIVLLGYYVTSDLGFVLFSFGAIALAYAAAGDRTAPWRRGPLLGSALCTGLMLLQKPGSGAMIALGMGLWLLAQTRGDARWVDWRRFRQLATWATLALIILSPYLIRNQQLFGTPVYSTESTDAWVLEYTDWDRIYAIYVDELGLNGGGKPDRSWLLRWGYDRTLAKVQQQVAALRDYLIPAWPGLPAGLAALAGRADKARLLADTGAWLTLVGALGALASRRRLLTLLGAAFVPYALFLVFYWHTNEERYWVALLPWLALLAALALGQGYRRIARIGDGRWSPVGLALCGVALALIIAPSWRAVDTKIREEPQLYTPDLALYNWLKRETPPDAVVMTRAPWQLNWHTERPALMIPYTTDPQQLLTLARHYNAQYLALESLKRPDRPIQQMVDRMVRDPQYGFTLVYESAAYTQIIGGRERTTVVHVYSFPEP